MSLRRAFVILLLIITPLFNASFISDTLYKYQLIVKKNSLKLRSLYEILDFPNCLELTKQIQKSPSQCAGDLTPRGTQLVQKMGVFYHAYYADKGLLLPVDECPGNKVYIWSDNVERTLGTANALVAGMSEGISGCMMGVNHCRTLRRRTRDPANARPAIQTTIFFIR